MPLSNIEFEAYQEKLSQKVKALTHAKRKKKVKDNVLFYASFGDPSINMNMKKEDKDGNPIACRHLARYWLQEESSRKSNRNSYHTSFYQPQNLPFLVNNDYDKQRLKYKNREYHFIALFHLGKKLAELAETLEIKEQLVLEFCSENHVMGFKVQQKDVGFRIKFYDPNKTVTHQQVWCPDIDSIAKLSIDDFLFNKAKNIYFPKFQGYLSVIVLVRQQFKDIVPLITIDEAFSEDNTLHYGLMLGFSMMIESSLSRILATDQLEPIDVALSTGKTFSSEEKLALVEAKNGRHTPGLFLALQDGNSEVVELYSNFIKASDAFSSDEKLWLLAAKNAKHTTGLSMALQEGWGEVIRCYCQALDAEIFFKILQLRDENKSIPFIDFFRYNLFFILEEQLIKLNSDQLLTLLKMTDGQDLTAFDYIKSGGNSKAKAFFALYEKIIMFENEQFNPEIQKKLDVLKAVADRLQDSSKECRVTSSEYDTLARHRHMLFGKTDSIKILDALNKQGYKISVSKLPFS